MLSRAYLRVDHSKDENVPEYQIFQLSQEQQLFQEIADINQVDYMRLSEGTHQQIKQCTVADAALQSLMDTIMTGWPQTKEEVPVCNHEYWNYKEELTVQDGVLFKGMKVIVPTSMRPQMIARVHSSHLGPDACVRQARDVLFWPGTSLLEWRNTPDSNGLSPVQKLMSRRTRTTIPTTEALLKPEVADGVYDNIKRKRQQAKAAFDKRATPLPELQVGEPVRLQPTNPKAPWEKGLCVAKVGPHSFLIETECGGLLRRNRKFIRQDPSQAPVISENTHSSAKNQTSAVMESPPTWEDSSVKQSQAMTQSCESPQPRVTTAEHAETLQPQQTVTRSGRTSVRPSRLKDFVT